MREIIFGEWLSGGWHDFVVAPDSIDDVAEQLQVGGKKSRILKEDCAENRCDLDSL